MFAKITLVILGSRPDVQCPVWLWAEEDRQRKGICSDVLGDALFVNALLSMKSEAAPSLLSDIHLVCKRHAAQVKFYL